MAETSDFNWLESSPTQTAGMMESFLRDMETMPRAFLFLGPAVSGAAISQGFVRHVTGQAFPNVDSVQFDAASETGNIEGIREVLSLAALKPFASPFKVVILSNMDQASPQVLNALLKNLEEPPSHSLFVLLSSRPLLATVMSRCQVIMLSTDRLVMPEALSEAFRLLETNRAAGLTEKLSLVNTLSEMEDEVLVPLLEHWMHKQTQELKAEPRKFPAVRCTMETLQALQRNFNRKMVLQNFVITGLV